VEPFDVLSLCAELAIAITGFSGVVLVFGAPARGDWSDEARIRFRVLFDCTLTPMGLIGLAFILDAAALERSTTWRICSSVYVPIAATFVFMSVRQSKRARPTGTGRPLSRIKRAADTFGFLVAVSVMALQLANASYLHAFWPFLVSVWWNIALSLWAFVGLLFPRRAA
jgi:hypothetical protein